MANSNNMVTYHSVEEAPNAHILEISFPKGHDKEEVTSILNEAGIGKRHSQFFNRSGVYIYFLTHNEKEKVYVGQATQLESRALNKARLKKEQVSRMLLFSTKRQHQFDEVGQHRPELVVDVENGLPELVGAVLRRVEGALRHEAREHPPIGEMPLSAGHLRCMARVISRVTSPAMSRLYLGYISTVSRVRHGSVTWPFHFRVLPGS